MIKTSIDWVEKSWNIVTGCTKISVGCRLCYAEKLSKRFAGRYGYPSDNPFRLTLRPDKFDEPLKSKYPSTILVCSMGDIFHGDVPYLYLRQIFDTMQKAHWQTFLVLTKRASVMRGFVSSYYEGKDYNPNKWQGQGNASKFLPNVWLGVSVENQDAANTRTPQLLQTPAAGYFISVEPMLEDIDISRFIGYNPVHEQSIKRENHISGSSGRGNGDRQPRKDLETLQARMGSVEQKNAFEQMCQSSSRTSTSTRLSTNSSDVPKCSLHNGSAQVGLPSFLWGDSERNNNQSQERDQVRQSPRESGIDDIFRTEQTHNLSTEKESTSIEPERGKQCNGQINSETSGGNKDKATIRGKSDEYSEGLRNSISACITDSEIRGVDKRFWVIVGGETGNRADPLNSLWVEHLQRQCANAPVPFFFKSWGEYIPSPTGQPTKVGKRHSGHLLNGKEYRQYPNWR